MTEPAQQGTREAGVSSVGRRVLRTLGAFTGFAALGTLGVLVLVRAPWGEVDILAWAATAFVLTLLGPLTFAWAVGPGPMGLVATVCAVLLPSSSLAMLYLGYFRAHAWPWLVAAAALWGGFGAFSAWVAILGSV